MWCSIIQPPNPSDEQKHSGVVEAEVSPPKETPEVPHEVLWIQAFARSL